MLSLLAKAECDTLAAVERRLRLIWKDPESGRYHEVGGFEALVDGRYVFTYTSRGQSLDAFAALPQFPDLKHVYVSDTLPAFLANRVMSDRRDSYSRYMHWLGLEPGSTPIEVLARTGGARATDTFHVVDSFEPDEEGLCEGRFFVSGLRHTPSGAEVATNLVPGAVLAIEEEPENPVNPRALLLSADGNQVGWVPDWLVEDVHRFLDAGTVSVIVERVNLDAPSHLRLLCRLRASSQRL